MKLRFAVPEDAKALLAIYAQYIGTNITFEYSLPSEEEFAARIRSFTGIYPYLVCEDGGRIVGYAYAHRLQERAAYQWNAELSIYLDSAVRAHGLGRRLYTALEKISNAQSIQNLYACIAYPETEDAHLTGNSVAFHTHMGYTQVGQFHRCGYKFNTWYNMTWMEKVLGDHTVPAAPFIAFPDLNL